MKSDFLHQHSNFFYKLKVFYIIIKIYYMKFLLILRFLLSYYEIVIKDIYLMFIKTSFLPNELIFIIICIILK